MILFADLFYKIKETDMLPCLSKQVLGIECPGCGLQRSVAFLIQGQFWESFIMYPGLFPMLFLFAFASLNYFLKLRKGSLITSALGVLSAGVILINFLIKLLL
jgi:hypothetical protein